MLRSRIDNVPLLLQCTPAWQPYRSYGVPFSVRSSSDALLRQVTADLPPGTRPYASGAAGRAFAVCEPASPCMCGQSHDGWQVSSGSTSYAVPGRDEALDVVRLWVKQYVAERAPRRVFVHAGVVAFGSQAVLIPGDSMSGKTTLVSALLRAGALYYSDEYAVLDARGRVWPYPQKLGMRRPGEGAAQHPVDAAVLGAVVARASSRAALIVVSRYEAGRSWSPQVAGPSDGAMALLAQSPAARRHPQRVLATLAAAASASQCLQGSRGDADETAALIVDYLRQLPAHPR